MSEKDQIRVKDRNDLIAAVPYLLGFPPEDSLVCVVVDDDRIRFLARLDLSVAAEGPELPEATSHLAELLARYGQQAIILGYGTPDRVGPVAELLRAALLAANVELFDAIRVTDDRYYCLNCDGECPPEGIAYNPSTSTLPAEATYEGIAPMPSRTALEDLIAPITGPRREAMRTASLAAFQRLHTMLFNSAATRADVTDGESSGSPAHVLQNGVEAVQQAIGVAARGELLSDDAAAWLTAVLTIPEVRDHAWRAIDGSEPHRRLWIDVTRRAILEATAAPACLLAIAAYLGGDGALANIAVYRSLQADPGYSLARLLHGSLIAGVAPQVWRDATIGTTD
ncbi:uncharacterized protein DUF4192 [Micromonospora sp. Llam0]|uniref:DUF4192 domain-containing protein n=1 Tax=Micromonospora sp. Llam0 TaxID=2485143 RepID=UPI000F9EC57A|nr:DUF4192 domain-containing protein [Micromonospora sp. Llam0]ROO60334.1 uncharacterized protein DUF4192 [Micromonospora sp. Llam0]